MPTASVNTESVATPLAFTAELPRVVVPLENVTVPVGVPGVPELTVAVTVTDCSKLDGFNDDISATLVLAF